MSKVFIDGHNALFALGLRGTDHDACRRALLVRVRARFPRAVVYFDGRGAPRDLPRVYRQEGVKVTYCKDAEADHEILEDVRHEQHPQRVLVVTNDRELAGRCRRAGARVTSVREALGEVEGDDVPPSARAQRHRRRPRVPAAEPRRAGTSPGLADGDAPLTPADFDLPDFVDPDDPRGI